MRLIIFFLTLVYCTLSFASMDVGNLYPLEFGKKYLLDSTIWVPALTNKSSEEYADILQFDKVLKGQKISANALATAVLKNPNTYKFKYHFLKFLQETPAERIKYPALTKDSISDVWVQIPNVYLSAMILMIEDSPVQKSYAPILEKLKELQREGSFKFVDLTESVREQWSLLSNKLHVSNTATTLTKDPSGKYVVNGVYNSNSKVFAMDLSLSRDENLITFAHEIVHIADPELIANKIQLQIHYSNLVQKIKLLFPNGDVEGFLSALIRDTFMEQGRFDIAEIQLPKATISSDLLIGNYQQILDEIRASGYDYLLQDPDFKGFIRNLISISVENEFKAYILSYALYSALRDTNSTLMPPSERRDQFIRKHFAHPSKLQDILKAEAAPFKTGAPLARLIPQYDSLSADQKQSPAVLKAISLSNILKKLIQNLYFTESRSMIERTTKEFEPLYNLISRTRFSDKPLAAATAGAVDASSAAAATSKADAITNSVLNSALPQGGQVGANDQFSTTVNQDYYASHPWLRPGQYGNSVTNPFDLAQAKMGSEAIILFKQNVEGLKRSLESIHDALLTMNSGVLPLNNLNFGELKWIGLVSVNDSAENVLPMTCKPEDRKDIYKQDPEAFEVFSRFVYNKTNDLNSPLIRYNDVKMQVFAMQLFKAVVWLRKEFPISQENFNTLKIFKRKLMIGRYDPEEISPERAEELLKEIDGYLKATQPRAEDVEHIKANVVYLMTALNNIENAVRTLGLSKLTSEFEDRISTALNYFQQFGVDRSMTQLTPEQNIEISRDQLIEGLKNSSFAKYCSTRDEVDLNRSENYRFHFGPNRTIENLTLLCYKRHLYVLRLPCGWSAGSTSFGSDTHGLITTIFNGGRKIIMSPLINMEAALQPVPAKK